MSPGLLFLSLFDSVHVFARTCVDGWRRYNWIHGGGTTETATRDHDGLGEGSHSPGGLCASACLFSQLSAGSSGVVLRIREALERDRETERQRDPDPGSERCGCMRFVDTDEGSTNWNITHNVVAGVRSWLAGCRAGCPWIGPDWQSYLLR